MRVEKEFTIYTDGACANEIGGYASLVLSPGKNALVDLSGGPFKSTTNNQMEMMGVIAGLEFVHRRMGPQNILVISDSKYVIEGITKWIHNWKKNQWFTAGQKPVKNRELWQRMDQARALHPLTRFEWVKGHAGDKYNEMADKLAVKKRQSDEKHRELGIQT
tara:strand:- start:633 stop:1118 length:486 start_codon:yes stop_codon:yes gene_type:complete